MFSEYLAMVVVVVVVFEVGDAAVAAAVYFFFVRTHSIVHKHSTQTLTFYACHLHILDRSQTAHSMNGNIKFYHLVAIAMWLMKRQSRKFIFPVVVTVKMNRTQIR